jgi:predicted RNA-binding Zn-ribbon protein involved in translation (DUF1610 family)
MYFQHPAIDDPTKENLELWEAKNPYVCPNCGEKGYWRSGGPHFENEKRCPQCECIWAPDEIATANHWKAYENHNVHGDGI